MQANSMSTTAADEQHPDDEAADHRARTRRTTAVVEARIAVAREQRDVLLILTGDGKSSSAFATAGRASAQAGDITGRGAPAELIERSDTVTDRHAVDTRSPAFAPSRASSCR